jgi:hypothetical protein
VNGKREVDKTLLLGEAPWYELHQSVGKYLEAANTEIDKISPESLAELFPVDIIPSKKSKKAEAEAVDA